MLLVFLDDFRPAVRRGVIHKDVISGRDAAILVQYRKNCCFQVTLPI
jgi:hypothetical protein